MPAAGNFYAKDFGRGLAGVAVRTVSIIAFGDADTRIKAFGVITLFGSTVYNFATCDVSVKRYNELNFKLVSLIANPAVNLRAGTIGFHVNKIFD